MSVFFGGGLPRLARAPLGRVLDSIRRSFAAEEGALGSPSNTIVVADAAKAHAFADVGVNRLSVGVQSLDDVRLRHSVACTIRPRSARSSTRSPPCRGDLMFGQPVRAPMSSSAR